MTIEVSCRVGEPGAGYDGVDDPTEARVRKETADLEEAGVNVAQLSEKKKEAPKPKPSVPPPRASSAGSSYLDDMSRKSEPSAKSSYSGFYSGPPKAAEAGAEEEKAKASTPPAPAPVSSGGDQGVLGLVPDELKTWTAASESRRNNPYLSKTPTYLTYEEVVEPKQVAETLFSVIEYLANEWREDLRLQFISDDPISQAEVKETDRLCREQAKNGELGDQHAPPLFESAERSRSGSTPLRKQNFDLLERTCTILAIKSLETELAYSSRLDMNSQRELEWLDDYCSPWWPRLTGVVRAKHDPALGTVCNLFIGEYRARAGFGWCAREEIRAAPCAARGVGASTHRSDL